MDLYGLATFMTNTSYWLSEFVNLMFYFSEMKGIILIIAKYKCRSLVINNADLAILFSIIIL